MSDFLELSLDSPVDGRHLVPVDVAPEGGNSIKVFPALGVEEVGSLPTSDDADIRIPFPFLLLGKGMPEVFFVFLGEGLVVHGRGNYTETAKYCEAYGSALSPPRPLRFIYNLSHGKSVFLQLLLLQFQTLDPPLVLCLSFLHLPVALHFDPENRRL